MEISKKIQITYRLGVKILERTIGSNKETFNASGIISSDPIVTFCLTIFKINYQKNKYKKNKINNKKIIKKNNYIRICKKLLLTVNH